MGCACSEQGEFENAIRWYQQSLELHREICGTASSDVVRSLDLLSFALMDAGRWTEAEATVVEALGLFAELSKNDQLACPDPALLMARIHLHRREHGPAERMLVRSLHHCLRSLEQFYGSKNYNWTDRSLAVVFSWLSGVYLSRNDLRAAERTIQKSIRMMRKNAEFARSIDHARMCAREAVVHERQGDLDASRRSIEEALAIANACRQPGHRDLVYLENLKSRIASSA